MTSTTQVTATGNVFVDALLNRTAWASESITFGFTTSSTQYSSVYGQGETSKGYQALSGTQVNAVKEAISSWAELINLKIVETSGTDADIRIAASSAPRTAWAYSPGTSAEAGDVWFGTGSNYYTSPKAGNYAFDTFVHELGHALGLAHPHENKLGVSGAGFTADDGTGQSLCPCCAGLVHGSVSNAEATAIEAAGEALTPAQIAAYYGTSTAGSAGRDQHVRGGRPVARRRPHRRRRRRRAGAAAPRPADRRGRPGRRGHGRASRDHLSTPDLT